MGSMAVAYSCNSFIPPSRPSPVSRLPSKVLMLQQIKVQAKEVSPLQIRSPASKTKVFEDQSQGIICYRDENGEIVCEGYDEGPRGHQQSSRTLYQLSDGEILDLLRCSYLRLANDGKSQTGTRLAAQEGSMIKWNGFNNIP